MASVRKMLGAGSFLYFALLVAQLASLELNEEAPSSDRSSRVHRSHLDPRVFGWYTSPNSRVPIIGREGSTNEVHKETVLTRNRRSDDSDLPGSHANEVEAKGPVINGGVRRKPPKLWSKPHSPTDPPESSADAFNFLYVPATLILLLGCFAVAFLFFIYIIFYCCHKKLSAQQQTYTSDTHPGDTPLRDLGITVTEESKSRLLEPVTEEVLETNVDDQNRPGTSYGTYRPTAAQTSSGQSSSTSPGSYHGLSSSDSSSEASQITVRHLDDETLRQQHEAGKQADANQGHQSESSDED